MAIRPTDNPCGKHGGDHLTDVELMTASLTGLPRAHDNMQSARLQYIAGEVHGGSVEAALNSMMCDYLQMVGLVASYEFRLGMAAGYASGGNTPSHNELHKVVMDLMEEYNLMAADGNATASTIGRSDAKGEADGVIKDLLFASSGVRTPPPWSENDLLSYQNRILRKVKNERYFEARATVAGQDAQAEIAVAQQLEIGGLLSAVDSLHLRVLQLEHGLQ